MQRERRQRRTIEEDDVIAAPEFVHGLLLAHHQQQVAHLERVRLEFLADILASAMHREHDYTITLAEVKFTDAAANDLRMRRDRTFEDDTLVRGDLFEAGFRREIEARHRTRVGDSGWPAGEHHTIALTQFGAARIDV